MRESLLPATSPSRIDKRLANFLRRIGRAEEKQFLTEAGQTEIKETLENLRELFGIPAQSYRAPDRDGAAPSEITMTNLAAATSDSVALTPSSQQYLELDETTRKELGQLVKDVMYGADRTAGDKITTLSASILTGMTAAQLVQIVTVTALEKLGINLANINESIPFRIGLGATIAGVSAATCVVLSCKSRCQTVGCLGRGEDKIKDMIQRGSKDLSSLSPSEVRTLLIIDSLAQKVSKSHQVDVGKASDPAKLVLAALCLGYAVSALYLGGSLGPTITTAVTAGVTAGGVVAKSTNSSGPDNVDKMLTEVSGDVETKLGTLMTGRRGGESGAIELSGEKRFLGRARQVLSNLLGVIPGCGPAIRSYQRLSQRETERESY